MKPLVSMIVPVYNCEKYIKECIESLRRQSYNNIEIIIVNDGSKDNSGLICDEIAESDSRILVLHIENNGVANARNLGISIAKGEYIAFCDSDDIMAPDFIEEAVSVIENADYVSGAFKTLKKNNENDLIDYMYEYDKFVDHNDYFKRMSKYQAGAYWGANWGKLFKSSIIKEKGILFESNVDFAEDFRFNLEYLKYVDKIAIIHKPVYYYRIDTSGSLSKKCGNAEKFWQEYLELYYRCKELYCMSGIFDEVQVELASFIIVAYITAMRRAIYSITSLTEIFEFSRRIELCSEVVDAAKFYKQMSGSTRIYGKLIYFKKLNIIAIILLLRKFFKF